MNSARDRRSRLLLFIYFRLIGFLILLGFCFICGTIYGVFFYKGPPNLVQSTVLQNAEKGQTFTGIGTIRVPTADAQPGMVILFISFIYYLDDVAFSEELALRVKDFRQIIIDYFSPFSVSELRGLDEAEIKSELLLRFNSILRLGQIETLYFGDFMIIG
jgi:flagellar basal body-associated protein FliL